MTKSKVKEGYNNFIDFSGLIGTMVVAFFLPIEILFFLFVFIPNHIEDAAKIMYYIGVPIIAFFIFCVLLNIFTEIIKKR